MSRGKTPLSARACPTAAQLPRPSTTSLNHWDGLSRYLLDGAVPIDNNHIENQMRPWALGHKNWLFIGSELAGERAAVVMSLLQSAKLNGHDPWAYLKDVLTRLPPCVRLDAMDASLFKREENWSAEIEQPLIRKKSLADGVDPLMDTASKCPRRDRPRSSQTPQGIRHES